MLLNLSLLHFYEVKDEQVFVPVFTEINITAKTIQVGMINNVNCHSLSLLHPPLLASLHRPATLISL